MTGREGECVTEREGERMCDMEGRERECVTGREGERMSNREGGRENV